MESGEFPQQVSVEFKNLSLLVNQYRVFLDKYIVKDLFTLLFAAQLGIMQFIYKH
jgi:hypothetical protein